MAMYVCCPECGQKLLKGEDCRSVQIKCTKCRSIINIKVENNKAEVSVEKAARRP